MTTQKCSYSPEPEEDEDLFCCNIGGQDAKVGYFLDISYSYTIDYIYFLNILVKKSLNINIRLPSRDPTI